MPLCFMILPSVPTVFLPIFEPSRKKLGSPSLLAYVQYFSI
jgi:hypothetical protein